MGLIATMPHWIVDRAGPWLLAFVVQAFEGYGAKVTDITVPYRKRFLVTSVSSDAHMWNLVFLQLLLEERGGDVVNLGICVPDEVIIDECLRSRPDVVVVSTVNGHGHIDGLRLIRKLRAVPELADVKIVIGGKLGVKGAENAKYGEELVANGFDAAFESGAGLADFERFLGSIRSEPRTPALAGSGVGA
jgi:methylmalonyl-CoA mutase cobalamin-binding subunit